MVVVEVVKGRGGFRERCWVSNWRTGSSGGVVGESGRGWTAKRLGHSIILVNR